MHKRMKNGQMTIELMLMFTAVIVVLFIFLRPQGAFFQQYRDIIESGAENMKNSADEIFNISQDEEADPGDTETENQQN